MSCVIYVVTYRVPVKKLVGMCWIWHAQVSLAGIIGTSPACTPNIDGRSVLQERRWRKRAFDE